MKHNDYFTKVINSLKKFSCQIIEKYLHKYLE